MYCRNCGEEMPDQAIVCGKCGTPVPAEDRKAKAPQGENQNNPYAYDSHEKEEQPGRDNSRDTYENQRQGSREDRYGYDRDSGYQRDDRYGYDQKSEYQRKDRYGYDQKSEYQRKDRYGYDQKSEYQRNNRYDYDQNSTQYGRNNQYGYGDYQRRDNGKEEDGYESFATISFFMSLISVASCFVPYVTIPISIAAILFGFFGRNSAKRKKAIIGMVIGSVMLLTGMVLVISLAALAPFANELAQMLTEMTGGGSFLP